MAKHRIVLVGAGQVSSELAPAWQQDGHELLHVISRTESSARPLGELLSVPWSTNLSEAAGALADAQVVVVAVTDAIISEVAEAISGMVAADCTLVHLSGATSLDQLRAPAAVVWPVRLSLIHI